MGFSLTTFLFEVANFLVLVWLLERILYRPLKRGIAERRQALLEREQQAVRSLEHARELEAELERQRGELSALREQTLHEASERAGKEHARILGQAREDAANERARAARLLQAERETARQWVRELAVDKSLDVVAKLLLELSGSQLHATLVERMLMELPAQAEQLKSAAASRADAHVEVDVTSAQLLDGTSLERLRGALASALGRAPELTLKEDGSLVAGVVLRVGHEVLDASIRGQLTMFRHRVRELLEQEASVG